MFDLEFLCWLIEDLLWFRRYSKSYIVLEREEVRSPNIWGTFAWRRLFRVSAFCLCSLVSSLLEQLYLLTYFLLVLAILLCCLRSFKALWQEILHKIMLLWGYVLFLANCFIHQLITLFCSPLGILILESCWISFYFFVYQGELSQKREIIVRRIV
jgi:hypothetical protein